MIIHNLVNQKKIKDKKSWAVSDDESDCFMWEKRNTKLGW